MKTSLAMEDDCNAFERTYMHIFAQDIVIGQYQYSGYCHYMSRYSVNSASSIQGSFFGCTNIWWLEDIANTKGTIFNVPFLSYTCMLMIDICNSPVKPRVKCCGGICKLYHSSNYADDVTKSKDKYKWLLWLYNEFGPIMIGVVNDNRPLDLKRNSFCKNKIPLWGRMRKYLP